MTHRSPLPPKDRAARSRLIKLLAAAQPLRGRFTLIAVATQIFLGIGRRHPPPDRLARCARPWALSLKLRPPWASLIPARCPGVLVVPSGEGSRAPGEQQRCYARPNTVMRNSPFPAQNPPLFTNPHPDALSRPALAPSKH